MWCFSRHKPAIISERIPLSHVLSASEHSSNVELPTDNKPHATAVFGTYLIDSASATNQCTGLTYHHRHALPHWLFSPRLDDSLAAARNATVLSAVLLSSCNCCTFNDQLDRPPAEPHTTTLFPFHPAISQPLSKIEIPSYQGRFTRWSRAAPAR